MENKFYTVEPIMKSVKKEEYRKFIDNYPRKLVCDACAISDPPAVSLNDFELANRWPYSIVARTMAWDDNPSDYFYLPEEERKYSIMVNYEEVYASRTGYKEE
jgi:hypothetical protein